MKASSTHELIKDLPELDEGHKAENSINEKVEETNEASKVWTCMLIYKL